MSALTRITTSPVLQISIVAAWLFAALVAFPFASKVNQDLDTAASLKGSESAQVEADLKQRFKSPFTKIALLRIASAPDPRTAEGGILLSQTVDAVKTASGVEAVLSAWQIGLMTVLVWVPILAAGHVSEQHWIETVASCALTAGAWILAESYRGTPWLALNKR